MRILINAVSAKAGGGITYLVNLLKYLPKIMPEDEFLCVIQDIELPSEVYTHNNLDIRVIKQASESVLKRYWWENTGLLKLCKRWKADLLYCIANLAPILPSSCPKVLMIQNVAPLTYKVFTMLYKYEDSKKFLQMLANTILTLVSAIISSKTIVLSKATQRLLKGILPFVSSKVIYHGIDPSSFTYKALKPVVAGKEPYFIFVSNLYVYKGLEFLLDAYKSDCSLPKTFIAGFPYDAQYIKKIKESIESNNLQEKIVFLNSIPHSELPGWYANAIGMVYTSWCENCPNIILEAKACGCPIIAMNIGPMPELCNGEEIIVKPFDGKSLAEGMQKAIELRKDSTLEARLLKYSKEFTWEKAMVKHRDCFRESYLN